MPYIWEGIRSFPPRPPLSPISPLLYFHLSPPPNPSTPLFSHPLQSPLLSLSYTPFSLPPPQLNLLPLPPSPLSYFLSVSVLLRGISHTHNLSCNDKNTTLAWIPSEKYDLTSFWTHIPQNRKYTLKRLDEGGGRKDRNRRRKEGGAEDPLWVDWLIQFLPPPYTLHPYALPLILSFPFPTESLT